MSVFRLATSLERSAHELRPTTIALFAASASAQRTERASASALSRATRTAKHPAIARLDALSARFRAIEERQRATRQQLRDLQRRVDAYYDSVVSSEATKRLERMPRDRERQTAAALPPTSVLGPTDSTPVMPAPTDQVEPLTSVQRLGEADAAAFGRGDQEPTHGVPDATTTSESESATTDRSSVPPPFAAATRSMASTAVPAASADSAAPPPPPPPRASRACFPSCLRAAQRPSQPPARSAPPALSPSAVRSACPAAPTAARAPARAPAPTPRRDVRPRYKEFLRSDRFEREVQYARERRDQLIARSKENSTLRFHTGSCSSPAADAAATAATPSTRTPSVLRNVAPRVKAFEESPAWQARVAKSRERREQLQRRSRKAAAARFRVGSRLSIGAVEAEVAERVRAARRSPRAAPPLAAAQRVWR